MTGIVGPWTAVFAMALAEPASPSPAPPVVETSVEFELRGLEALVETDRRRAITLLEAFRQQHPQSRAIAEALFRLASLYWERSQGQFVAEMDRFSAHVQACKAKPETCPHGPPKEPRLELGDAQALYLELIAQHPGFRKIDTVRYLVAFSLREQGKTQEALDQYHAILRLHPRSTFVPDAWMALGDHQFYAQQDFQAARTAYAQVLSYPRSDAYPMALFKTAWCHWKEGSREAAVLRFKQVLDQAKSPSGGPDDEAQAKRLQDLREEALAYLVQVLTEDETRSPGETHAFLTSIGGQAYARTVLTRLAEAYEAQVRFDKSIATYRFVLSLDPQHVTAPDLQLHLASGLRGMGDVRGTLSALAALEETYGPRSRFAQVHPDAARQGRARAEQLLFDLARSVHESAQAAEEATKVPDRDRFALAADAYEDYRKRFPAEPRAVEAAYFAGDIYRLKLGRLVEAGDAYLRVGESAPVGALHKDALLAAIASYEAATPSPAPTKSEAPGPPRPETPSVTDAASVDLERKLAHASHRFVSLFPADERAPSVLLQVGRRALLRGDPDTAMAALGRVLVEYPASPASAPAAEHVLECLAASKDYAGIETWTERLRESAGFAAAQDQARLASILVEVLFKQAEALLDRGYDARAAGYYLRVAAEHPGHERAPLALHNAGAALERAGQTEVATETYLRLAKDYPKAPEAPLALFIAARLREKVTRYQDAARIYDELAQHYPQHPSRADALFNAALLYRAVEDYPRALACDRAYVTSFGDRDDAAVVLLRIGRTLVQTEKLQEAVEAYRSFLKRYPKHRNLREAQLRLGLTWIRLDQRKTAERLLTSAAASPRPQDPAEAADAKRLAAEAQSALADLAFQDFQAATLDPSPRKLRASLESKAKLLALVKSRYLEVVELGVATWSSAALLRIGSSYQTFAKELRDYPMPPGLSEDDQLAYKEQLDTFALAFEEQAIAAYKTGYEKALALGLYDRDTRALRRALSQLSKREFPPILEIGTDPVPARPGWTTDHAIRELGP